jgi:hypothetical protein
MAATLEKAYKAYNKRYFRGRLPNVEVRWSRILGRGWYGESVWLPLTECGKKKFTFGLIRLADWMKPHWEVWNLTLLHEMVHIKLRKRCLEAKVGPQHHSKKWHDEMRGLAERGAFDELL